MLYFHLVLIAFNAMCVFQLFSLQAVYVLHPCPDSCKCYAVSPCFLHSRCAIFLFYLYFYFFLLCLYEVSLGDVKFAFIWVVWVVSLSHLVLGQNAYKSCYILKSYVPNSIEAIKSWIFLSISFSKRTCNIFVFPCAIKNICLTNSWNLNFFFFLSLYSEIAEQSYTELLECEFWVLTLEDVTVVAEVKLLTSYEQKWKNTFSHMLYAQT